MDKTTQSPPIILNVINLTKAFKGLLALNNVNLELFTGEIQGIIGPNGAGKTTLFNCLTGTQSPTSGEIIFNGKQIGGLPTTTTTKLGIARTFQNIKLFGKLTVLDNVRVAQQLRTTFNLAEVFSGVPSFWRKEQSIRDSAFELLDTFDLLDVWDQTASNLPYGAQRRLEMARALATQPQILLLDEPAAGMNETETDVLHQMISRVRERFKVSIILVEHDMRLIMNLCERITVLSYGEVIARGTPADIRGNQTVIEAYLGKN
ncbi:MAG: ABC transporter ATP-binding protein [Anaerolineae bacterium]|nr:ABC transporter ATP-binding protein [Anaerolineae bacterium]